MLPAASSQAVRQTEETPMFSVKLTQKTCNMTAIHWRRPATLSLQWRRQADLPPGGGTPLFAGFCRSGGHLGETHTRRASWQPLRRRG